ncbi:MAG: T9SS type A sorting domain-containing protein [Bacteroidota bacterium]
MIRFFTFTFLLAWISPLAGQAIKDTVSTGPGYTQQIWYKLDGGEETSGTLNAWDLAFEANGQSAAIFLNAVKGMQLFVYPNGDTTDWRALDTAGFNSWAPLYNSPASWRQGAFNAGTNPSDPFDLGWGKYNTITHHVTGDSLFVVKMADGSYQKLWIESLISGTYTFRHAALGDTAGMRHVVVKSNFADKNFGYFDMAGHQTIDPEPNRDDWDFLFTKYTAFIPVPYGVSGIKTNAGVQVATIYPVDDVAAYNDTANLAYSDEADVIGWDWKQYTGSWSIEDSTVYIVKAKDGKIWKLVMEGFGGSADGNYMFSKELLSETTPIDGEIEDFFWNVYPNPAPQGVVNLVMDAPRAGEAVSLSIINMEGKTVFQDSWNSSPGLFQQTLSLSHLSVGVYIVRLGYGDAMSIKKIVISR